MERPKIKATKCNHDVLSDNCTLEPIIRPIIQKEDKDKRSFAICVICKEKIQISPGCPNGCIPPEESCNKCPI